LAYDLALRSAELTKYQDANILTALAYANFKLGNVDRAIELQEQAIPIGDANPEIPDRNKQLMRSRLEMFRKARLGK
jgi:tetratricopeptide (TPR) repeat protein